MAVDSMSSDELLQLKKRARRRLVGAIALMLIALVVLRFVVQSRPPSVDKPAEVAIDGLKPAASDERTQAFAPPKNPESASMNASGETPPSGGEVPVATQKADSGPLSPIDLAPAARGTAANKPLPEPRPEPIPKPESKPRPEPKPARQADTAAAPKPSAAEADRARAASKAEAKPGRHVASVAALSDPSRAAELQRKLRAQGVKTFTETVEVGGKTLTRVKIGPYENAEALENARAKLALMGLKF